MQKVTPHSAHRAVATRAIRRPDFGPSALPRRDARSASGTDRTRRPVQPVLAFATATAFRRWLEAHHADHPGIWMRIAKKASGLSSITYAEALEEALCYGWIDGQRRRYDAVSFLQKFTRRGPRSLWSRINTGHVERLTREGRMRSAGLAAVEAAQADGRWAQAYSAARDFVIPADFLAALAKHLKARECFETLNKANRNAIGFLLTTARKPETRARRFARLLGRLKRGQSLLLLLAILGLPDLQAAGDATPAGLRLVLPQDPAVLDARRDLGAVGDGVADDTGALQRGIDASCGVDGPSRVLFLPNGIYRVTDTLVVRASKGPWLWGESRDGTVIRMADGVARAVTNCTAVLRTHPSDSEASSADFFMRNLRNLTIDAGDNPGLDGIRFYGNNSGLLKNMRVVGNGRIGINNGFLGQNGPNLIQDVTVEGFDTGIRCAWSWGATLSRITLRRCRTEGVYVNASAVGIEDPLVEQTPVALRNEYPNDWRHWGGVVALIGGRFTGTHSSQPAITNTSLLYAREVTSTGYCQVLLSAGPGGSVAGPSLEEHASHPPERLFPTSPGRSLRLPIQAEPELPWETDVARWVCVNEYGAVAGDNRDDTAAFQAALDAAAAEGKTTVYLRGIGGPDPNHYTVEGEVRVQGSVRHLLGLGFGRVIGGPGGRFVVDDRSAPVVKFQNLQAFGGSPPAVENRSAGRTLVVESCDLRVVGTGRGDIFVTDCPSHVELRSPGQSLWARQLNPEGASDVGLVRNHGGRLWALGVKHEGAGVRFLTDQGGETEILGLFLYGPGNLQTNDARPIFDIRDAQFCVMGFREISFGTAYPVKVRETRGAETRTARAEGWTGWTLFSGWEPSARRPARR